jgi:pyruvate dehydrogenase E1 component
VLAAAELLEKDWKHLRRRVERDLVHRAAPRRHEAERATRCGKPEKSWVAQCLEKTEGPVIAASDYVSAVADLIRPYVERKYVALGTDGFGRSDTRAALRDFFEVDARHIAVAALAALDPSLVGVPCAGTGSTRWPGPPGER